ncbi:outer membrane porin protein [Bordetella ansorpii]|uniref:Outer membrane porin protein n=1 Tax=Bordetella ansorpii TaxID=288768 RepID=A0A157QYZ0_9BORD|nr:porin [Bordetella ansorpii]SAI50149.1 outer membrane porin protein [Bordetella ansorpii]
MKKTLFAAALAVGYVGAAQAADSVTLYGLIDSGIGYEQVKGPNFKQSRFGAVNGVSSGSRFGMRGNEDLGGGLSAIFTLEAGYNSQTGTSAQGGRLFGRQSTVGLADASWGKIEFGRQTNMASKYFGSVDPFGTSYSTANLGTTFSAGNTMRLDNLVLYQSPNFGGFSFGAGYSFNADSTSSNTGFATNDNNRILTLGARYTQGPLDLIAAYDRMNPTNAQPGGQDDARIQSYVVGGTYDFEVVKLHATWGQTFDGWFVGTGMGTNPTGFTPFGNYALANGSRVDSTMLGFTLPLGNSSVFGSWQRADPKNSRLTGDDKTFNVFALGSTYNLSKRTNLYAYAAYGNNYAFQEDVKDTAVAVGIRHKF